jgi:hypothetical protein
MSCKHMRNPIALNHRMERPLLAIREYPFTPVKCNGIIMGQKLLFSPHRLNDAESPQELNPLPQLQETDQRR